MPGWSRRPGLRSGGLLTPDPCCMCAGQVSGYDVVANGASTALLNMTATGAGFGSATRHVDIYLECQTQGTTFLMFMITSRRLLHHTVIRQAEDSAALLFWKQEAAGGRRLPGGHLWRC